MQGALERGSLYKILVTTPEEKGHLVVLGVDGKIKLTKVKKSKVVPCHAIKAYGRKGYGATYSVLNGGEWSTSHLGRFTPGKEPSVHGMGG